MNTLIKNLIRNLNHDFHIIETSIVDHNIKSIYTNLKYIDIPLKLIFALSNGSLLANPPTNSVLVVLYSNVE